MEQRYIKEKKDEHLYAIIKSILTYRAETWRITEQEKRKLEARYGRIEKISENVKTRLNNKHKDRREEMDITNTIHKYIEE